MTSKKDKVSHQATILIVEDSPTQALQLQHLLEEAEYQVLVALNGQEALELLKNHQPAIIISDILMPGMDGFELCKNIKHNESLRNIPVVLLTSLSDPHDVISGLECGASNFITKPYEEKDLLNRLQYILINLELRKGQIGEIVFEVYFAGKKHYITADRMQIIDLLFSTYETAVQKNKDLTKANKELADTKQEIETFNEQLEIKIADRTKKLSDLNSVVLAIRNVNQLIVKEKNRDKLIKQACEELVESRYYQSAWIVLLDDSGKVQAGAEAGLGEEFGPLFNQVKHGEVLPCFQEARNQSDPVIIADPLLTCTHCLYPQKQSRQAGMAVRLEHEGKVCGVLSVSAPPDVAQKKEEQSLFKEVAGDIAFALHSIELDEQRKQAEEALRETEKELREAQRIAHLGSWVWDENTDTVIWSEEIYHIFGRDPALLAPRLQEHPQILTPESWAQLKPVMEKSFQTGTPFYLDLELVRPDGTRKWISAIGEAVRDASGQVVKLRGTAHDITERKEAEKALQRSEDVALRLAHENAIIAEIGRIISSTLNIEEVYERFAEEAKKLIPFDRIGISIFDLNHQRLIIAYVSGHDVPDRRQGDNVPLAGSVGEELLTLRSSVLLQTEKEEEWGEQFSSLLSTFQAGIRSLIAVPLFSKDQVIGFLHLQSLTPKAYTETDLRVAERVGHQIAGAIDNAQLFAKHERAESEKVSLQAQLQQSQKMEAIGRLAGGVAHDFNNLLTVISIQSQLALQGLREDDPLKERLKDIEQAANRAADLTRQLLAFSRRQILEMKVINLNFILKDMEKMLGRIIGEDIELKALLADDLGMVKVDPGQMEQVIVNLAVNAKDAMPQGGKLSFETANVELDEEYTRSHVGMIPGAYVMLSITDTGMGMSKEVKERIFDPFFTTKEKGKGTGLGLSTVYGIVKQSGGDTHVNSEPNQGTTFWIYLPRVFEAPEELKKVTVEEHPRGTETILVVEDDPLVRRLAVDILKTQGYRVLEATEGGEALVMCEKKKEPIHLILTDVVMPHMSGPEFIERLRQVRKDFKVLYMTGYTEESIVQHGVLEAGVNLIHKPFTIEKLARKVREVIDRA